MIDRVVLLPLEVMLNSRVSFHSHTERKNHGFDAVVVKYVPCTRCGVGHSDWVCFGFVVDGCKELFVHGSMERPE